MKRSAPAVVAACVAAALIALLVYGVTQQGNDSSLDKAVQQGKRPPAPDRSLPALNGSGQESLAKLRGQVVILNFWASWCDPCVREAPKLEAAQRKLQRAGEGTVLGVTYQDVPSDSVKFLREHGLSYPNARDIGTKLAKRYGTRALPETFVVDRRGRIVAISRGEVTQAFLNRSIGEALRE
jgi:cytochrome c biogenesis protein CcmG, thiol:disulfide interchange protein DsbE